MWIAPRKPGRVAENLVDGLGIASLRVEVAGSNNPVPGFGTLPCLRAQTTTYIYKLTQMSKKCIPP